MARRGDQVPGPPRGWALETGHVEAASWVHRPQAEWFVRTAGGCGEEGFLLEEEPWRGGAAAAGPVQGDTETLSKPRHGRPPRCRVLTGG